MLTLSLVFLPPTHSISTPFPWYVHPPMHGISTPLPMVFRTPYPWYFDPLYMVFWLPYPCYLELPTMVFRPLFMLFCPPYSWYIELPTHRILTTPIYGILTPLSISWLEMRGVKIPWGFNLTYRRSVLNKGVNIPWIQIYTGVNLPRRTIWHRARTQPYWW
jgi:hypothetical protein